MRFEPRDELIFRKPVELSLVSAHLVHVDILEACINVRPYRVKDGRSVGTAYDFSCYLVRSDAGGGLLEVSRQGQFKLELALEDGIRPDLVGNLPRFIHGLGITHVNLAKTRALVPPFTEGADELAVWRRGDKSVPDIACQLGGT